jgi:hypothetical protein
VPALHASRNALVVAGAHGLGHHGIEREERAHAEDGGGEEVQVAKRDARERRRRKAPHHDGVHDTHQHESDLHPDHGKGEHEQCPAVGERREDTSG